MPSWTDSSDRQLLLSIIHASAVSTPKWDQIALLMGQGYTAESVRQRFQKLKKAGKEEFGELAAVDKGAAPKGKGRAKSETPKKPAPGKGAKGKRKGAEVGEAEAGEDDEESPVKKAKVGADEDEDAEVKDEAGSEGEGAEF